MPALLLCLVFIPYQSHAQEKEKAGRFDNGKMWTFDHPPVDYFEEAYDFRLDVSWFDKARLGTLRIPGCTASFVSSYGLILTNHHCGRNAVTQVSAPDETLTEDGFYAESLEEERRVPGYYADQLVAIEDVTSEIVAAEDSAETDAERAQARQDAIEAIQARHIDALGEAGDNHIVEVIPLYHGGLYSAYTFRRYTDVRLVMTPELQLGYFGGDADNFTFPRYSLDMTFFRVYEDDKPLEPDDFFLWSLEGVQAGDAVFVIGNPGSTSRLETVAQLELRRDVTDKNLLAFIVSHIQALEAYQAATTASARNAVRNQLFSLLNSKKAFEGRLGALDDPVIMARRQDAERQFVNAIRKDSTLAGKYGDVVDLMAAIQKEKRVFKAPHGAFFALTNPSYSSAWLRRAMVAYSLSEQSQAGGENERLEGLKEQLLGIVDLPDGLDFQFLKTRLSDIEAAYGSDSDLVQSLLEGNAIEDVVRGLLEGSVLASQEKVGLALEAGSVAEDPAVDFVGKFIETLRAYQSGFAGLNEQETHIGSQIGRARFAVYGTDVPPDATFSLRIADGVVQGYPYNGTYATPFTSFYGLYDHYHSYGLDSEWSLPERWQTPPSDFDLAVPMNFASTNDIIGGNSGSPIVNKDLELVGVIFDGNIESLSGNYIYLPELARSVSVDARGMLEVLEAIYEADRLVEELANDELVSTEAEIDSRQ